MINLVNSNGLATTYFSDGTQTVYEYSPSGNLLHVTGETGTISYSYNKAGLLVSQVDHGAGETTYYSYNKAGQKTKIESDSRTLVYSYGKNAEVIKVEDYTTKMAVYLTYDVMGRETKRQYKNGVSENTVYDKLGRVILKSETNLYEKVYFAESYVYKEGKRALTVTDKGAVTLYKYNQRGEIESVYYPYSESLEMMAKKEALEAGLYPNFAEFEWYNYSNEEQEQIKEALGRIYKNIPQKKLDGQRVWSEHYTYDNNSNRLTKTTKYGTINYTYDDENRLRYSGKENLVDLEAEIGGRITFAEDGEIYYAATSDSVAYNATSLKGTRFIYDANGNMLSSESLYSVKFFDYNENNRMKLSTVTDLIEHSYTATTYAYDGFGRRTLAQTQGETATRTLYDGTSFEILRQGTADSNGSFVNVAEAEQRQGYYPQTRGFGNHYNKHGFDDYFYYLFFGGIWGFGNGGHGSNGGKEEAPEYLSIENMYPIYANGTVSGTYTENLVYSPHQDYWNKWQNFWGADASKYDDYATYKETLYFGTDVLGSVRSTTNVTGAYTGNMSYEIFGKPYEQSGSFATEGSLDFGYLGKSYNADTELYDYGFRDYSPNIARFTTVDPIRDGRNWYCYVVNDPVNYFDLWGLECKSESDGKQKIVVFSAIDLWNSPNNILYNILVADNYREIEKTAKKVGYDFELINGKDATSTNFDTIKQDSSIARLIVVAHGDQYAGYLWGVDDKELSIKNATVPVIDMVGCYASKNKEQQNSTVKVNTYNPGCTTPSMRDDDQILFYQTNEVIKETIPAAIESGNINSTKEPSKNSFLDKCVSIFDNIF